MDYNIVPHDLRTTPQWVCYRMYKGRKVPINPRNGRFASCNNPDTWGTFEECLEAYNSNANRSDVLTGEAIVSGLGFVLTANDDFACIDLDLGATADVAEKQTRIYNTYKDVTYCEVSPSGGLHVWLKTDKFKVCKSDKIEFYFESRFITITGKAINPRINTLEFEGNIESLITWVRPQHNIECEIIYADVKDAEFSDDEICNQAYNAANGKKFYDLFYGEWKDYYASQSEADFALINILAFYSKSNAQVKNIFRKSSLGKREKAQRDDYVDKLILRSRDSVLKYADGVDLVTLKEFVQKCNAEQELEQEQELEIEQDIYCYPDDAYQDIDHHSVGIDTGEDFYYETDTITGESSQTVDNIVESVCNDDEQAEVIGDIPEFVAYRGEANLLGDIADYVYASSPRPVREFGVAAAIALLSGIVGRCYNVSGTGLNQYTLMLAASGVGKEAMASGIDNLINSVCEVVPDAERFVGAGDIASSQALINKIAGGQTSFVSIFGEFGLKMRQMSAPNAPSHLVGLRAAMLDLYNKSGANKSLRPSIYADKDKNMAAIKSPNFSFLGESTPMRFYDGLTEDMVLEGLLPRFNIIEYEGIRVPYNKKHLENSVVPAELQDRLAALCSQAISLNERNAVINVTYSHDAEEYLDRIDKLADSKINGTTDEVERTLWNRVHIKVLKLAALAAVSRNMYFPEIQYCDVEWAYDIILQNTIKIVSRFKKGVVDDANESCFQVLNNHIWAEYKTATYVRHADLYDKFKFKAPFKQVVNGQTKNLLNQTIQDLQDAGILELMDKTMLRTLGLKGNSKVYQIVKRPDRMDGSIMPEVNMEFKNLKNLTIKDGT